MLYLLELPNEVLINIFKNSSVRSLLTLRKVCRDLRNFIDDARPALENVKIGINIHFNVLHLIFSRSQTSDIIRYEPNQTAHAVKSKKLKPLPPVPTPASIIDFVADCLRELNTILKILNIKTREFSILPRYSHDGNDQYFDPIVNNFLHTFIRIYESRPLQVESLTVWMPKSEQLTQILPCFNPRKLSIWSKRETPRIAIPAEELVNLEYWKRLESFEAPTCMITDMDFRNFSHLKNCYVRLASVTCKDVLVLKEEFLASPHFEQFKIDYLSWLDSFALCVFIGPPTADREWHFPVVNSEHTLHISLSRTYPPSVMFSKKLFISK